MAHKFGDVVVYQMGKVSVNALVVQSNPQPDGEHLVCVYLDPAVASNSMAGSLVDKAIAKAFPAPLQGSAAYGWKDLPVADKPVQPSAEDLDAAALETKVKEATAKITSTSHFSGGNPGVSPAEGGSFSVGVGTAPVHPPNTVHE